MLESTRQTSVSAYPNSILVWGDICLPLLFTIRAKLRDSFAKPCGNASVTASMKTSAAELCLKPYNRACSFFIAGFIIAGDKKF